jgi:spore coat polysaccharide biosynthesis protein SpsF
MLCVLQARLNSKRFPKKILKRIFGHTILSRVYYQLKKSKFIKKIVIATSNSKSDDPLEKYCFLKNMNFNRGSELNVASRFFNIVKKNNFNYFVRICGDSPLIDFKLIDKMAKFTKRNKYDIITNIFPRTFPKGQSIEIIKSSFFLKYYPKIRKKYDKEHVTPFFYNNAKNFKIKKIISKKNYKNLNYCVDFKNDLKLIKKILVYYDNKIPSLSRLDKINFN